MVRSIRLDVFGTGWLKELVHEFVYILLFNHFVAYQMLLTEDELHKRLTLVLHNTHSCKYFYL